MPLPCNGSHKERLSYSRGGLSLTFPCKNTSIPGDVALQWLSQRVAKLQSGRLILNLSLQKQPLPLVTLPCNGSHKEWLSYSRGGLSLPYPCKNPSTPGDVAMQW